MLKMRTCAYVHHPCTLAHTPNCTQECIKSVIYIDKRTHACKSKRKEKTINQTNVAHYFEQN